jgi:hypothetical protein
MWSWKASLLLALQAGFSLGMPMDMVSIAETTSSVRQTQHRTTQPFAPRLGIGVHIDVEKKGPKRSAGMGSQEVDIMTARKIDGILQEVAAQVTAEKRTEIRQALMNGKCESLRTLFDLL